MDTASLLFSPEPSSVNAAVSTVTHGVIVKRPADSEDAATSVVVSPICKMPKLVIDTCTTVTSCITPGRLHFIVIHVSFV